jgi:molybdopterin-guanine dinucleotide biosynthesis protein A
MICPTEAHTPQRPDGGQVHPCSAVILAGGLNTRFGGRAKTLTRLGGTRLLDRIYSILRPRFQDLILVTNTPADYLKWNLTIVSDIYPERSSLTGIHAGLFHAQNPHAFVVAGDTPFLNPGVVQLLLGRIDPQADLILPVISLGNEPMCAIYSRKSLHAMEKQLERKRYKIMQVFRRDRIKPVTEKPLRQVDPELRSFFNINTPEDLARAEALLAAEGAALDWSGPNEP